jgi:glycerate 2-kinase
VVDHSMKSESFLTQSLRDIPQTEPVTRILAAAINAVDPGQAIRRYLTTDDHSICIGEKAYPLAEIDRIFVIGFGKASVPMAAACAEVLGTRLTAGIVITKGTRGPGSKVEGNRSQFDVPNSLFTIFSASHPVPDERGVAAAGKIIDLLATTTENDLVICLISGGGSALLTSPVPEISLDDIQALTKVLLGCGATINEINTLRKHLSQVKGGQLARWAAPAQIATLILSDVIGDPLDVIASGPFVPDPTTFQDCLTILQRYQIGAEVPAAIRKHLNCGVNGDIPDTPQIGDPSFEKVHNVIVGNNLQAAQAAILQAKMEGISPLLLTTSLQGEAATIGQTMAAIAQQIAATGDPIPRPACIVAGGETTVTIGGEGLGGRNQELALGAVAAIAGLDDVILITLATDGDDGPTDAAGAVVTGETLDRAALAGLNPAKFLAQNDAYNFFDPLGDLLKPGMTGTNVCDLIFIFAF